MPMALELSGKRFGYLEAICLSNNSENKIRKWVCKCDCGNIIEVRTTDLTRGNTKSCGCYQKKIAKEIKQKHGGSNKRIYSIWCNMKTRCLNKNTHAYKNYGGRGISVCQEWLDFTNFYNWAMENGYSDELTIERKNTNGNYEPSNCVFIPKSQQPLNTRKCRFIFYNGETKTLTEWSKQFHFGRNTFRKYRKNFSSDEETLCYFATKQI